MTSPIDDKSKQPDENDVAEVLGEAYSLWTSLNLRVRELCPDIAEEWTFSGEKYGWSLRLSRKKKTVLRMKPKEGFISAGLIYGEAAYQSALTRNLPSDAIEVLREAVKFPEGWGIRVEIRSNDDVALVHQLAAIKLAL